MNDELNPVTSIPHSAFRIPHFPPLYPLTDTTLTGLTHAEQVARLIEGGARIIQLRDKHSAPRAFYAAAREALTVARAANVPLIINDRADIALALQADGVHLGQNDLPAEAARRLLGDAAIIGVSTHNLAQACAAAKLPVSYIAIGPVFHTTSKTKPDPIVGLDGVRQVRASLPAHIPLVAIGGITMERARAALDAGDDSIACLGATLADPDNIAGQTRLLLTRIS